MFERIKRIIAVLLAIVEAARTLAAYVETEGNGEAKKQFVMGAFEVLFALDDGFFDGFIGEKLTAAADKVVELWVAFDKALGGLVFRKAKEEIGGDIVGNS